MMPAGSFNFGCMRIGCDRPGRVLCAGGCILCDEHYLESDHIKALGYPPPLRTDVDATTD